MKKFDDLKLDNKKPIDDATLNNAFDYVIQIIKDVEYSIFFGTLLGIIRENSLLKNDDDIDFLVDYKNKQKIITLLLKSDLKLDLNKPVNSGEYFIQAEFNNKDKVCLIDFYFYELTPKQKVLLKSIGGPYQEDKKQWMYMTKNTILPFTDSLFNNMKIKIPNEPTKVLRYLYGRKWNKRIEKKDYLLYFFMNKPRIIKSKIIAEFLKFLSHKKIKKLIKAYYYILPITLRKRIKKFYSLLGQS